MNEYTNSDANDIERAGAAPARRFAELSVSGAPEKLSLVPEAAVRREARLTVLLAGPPDWENDARDDHRFQ